MCYNNITCKNAKNNYEVRLLMKFFSIDFFLSVVSSFSHTLPSVLLHVNVVYIK